MEKKLILVARVSDVEQRVALPAQKRRLEQYARESYKDSEYKYYEFDESAYKDARHKFSQLVDEISKMDGNLIVVFDKIDRFTRDASQQEVNKMSKLVDTGKVELHFPSDNLAITQYSPATDKFRLGMGMLLAKYYSDSSRDNVKRRFEQMLNDGIWVHRAPVGYKNIVTGGEGTRKPTKDIIVDKEKTHYVTKAFELRAENKPYAVVAKELGAMGFRSNTSSKPPTKQFIERLLTNPFYYGVMVQSGKRYPHKYEPLIDRALFNKVQAVRDDRKHEKTKYDSKDYTFKKIVKCGRCGRAVSPFKARNTVYLRCANPKCDNPNTAESLVVGEIERELASVNVSDGMLDQIISELRTKHDDQQLYYVSSIDTTRKEYDQIVNKMDANYRHLLDGRITQDLHDKMANELERRQQDLNERLKMLTSDNKDFHVTASYLLDLAQRAEKLFQNSDETLRQKLLEYMLSNIELNDKKLSYKLADPFGAMANAKKKSLTALDSNIWCGLGDSNSWPLPWQGSALTTELNPHVASFIKRLLEWTR